MSRLLKTLIFSFLFLLLAAIFPQTILAEPQEFIKAVQEGNNLQWYLGGKSGMLATTTDSLLVSIVGAYDENGKLISSGALQGTSTLMASLYQKPASTTQYLAYVMNHSGLAKSAFAQGAGWQFLTNPKECPPAGTSTAPTCGPSNVNSPILVLWTTTRNIAYLFFIVIFVAIGFMIMFRSKLNPQAVVNIQLALPKIIVSLILVTFSFAICGFIIDFVYLGHNLIGAIFFESTDQPFHYLLPLTGYSSYQEAVNNLDVIGAFLSPTATFWGGINIWTELGNFMVGMSVWLLSLGKGVSLAGTLIPLIFAFTLLGTALKIFFALITKYVTLILSTIFSPFIFLFSAFPGKSEGISNFLKTMLSAALTFPAVAFMFFLASYFVSKQIGLQLESLPPLNKVDTLAGSLGGVQGFGRVLEPLIALGLLMATTQVPQAIDQMLGVKPGIAGAATPEVGGALRKIPIIGSFLG